MAHLLRSLSVAYRDGHSLEGHRHSWGQLIYSAHGAIHVIAAQKAWLIPPARAVFVPAGITHSLKMRGACALRTIYLPDAACSQLPAVCTGIEVTRLLRELILLICSIGVLLDDSLRHRLSAGLLIEELASAKALDLMLTMPLDRRASRVAALVWAAPSSDTDLDEFARQTGASVRTLQRLFLKETGLRFTDWRQTVRLLASCTALLDGASVTDAGQIAGFSSSSAFIAAFRARVGITPLQYKRGIDTQ